MRSRRLKNVVWLRLLYDPFAPETVETHELKWRKGATLADYLDGLPPEAEWMIFVNGREIDIINDGEMVLEREDAVGLILVPQGGNGGIKSVMRIVLQAAAMAAMLIPGVGWAAALAINVGIGLINAFLMTPKQPKKDSEERSYGIDGAKASATEGIPYPVVYGEFRTAGNYSDCYTVNVGDVQYLYIRAVLNDGEIAGVSDIEINEQPISTFTDVQTRVALGKIDQDLNDWFTNSVVQVNKNQKIDTAYLEHVTGGEVDKIRWDIVFTSGLANIDEKKGTYKNRSVTFQMEVQRIDPVTGAAMTGWTPAASGPNTIDPDLNGDGILTLNELSAAALMARAKGIDVQQSSAPIQARAISSTPEILVRAQGTTEWSSFGTFDTVNTGFAYDDARDGSIAGDTDITPHVNQTFSGDLPAGNYEFKPINGAEIVGVQTWPSAQSLSRTITDKRTRQIRHSFETGQLTKGVYKCRIRRTTATSTDQYKLDEVFLSDIAEIELDQVPQIGTASLSLRIKLTEQLNSMPNLTSKVRGSVCMTYDIEGNPTGKKWTANPAWLGLDVICGEQRGSIPFERAVKRVDWPRWIEFAEYCEREKLFFNGVFAERSNVGDALNGILRIGHAAPIPFGTKISVAIDRKRDPVAYFGPAQILKDSFEISYMSMADRANEYEVTYYDKLDKNKAKTLRYVDPKAVRFNEVQRLSQVSFPGIDNVEQAKRELWRSIYANRLLMRTITFDSFMDSINMALGEVALIQHDQMSWANGGLLGELSTPSTLMLDRAVAIDGDKQYAALVHYDALKVAERAVGVVAGRKIMVTGDPIAQLKAGRLLVGEQDIEIVSMVDGNPYHTITLASAPTGLAQGSTVELWDTDVLVERTLAKLPSRTNYVATSGNRGMVDVGTQNTTTVSTDVAPRYAGAVVRKHVKNAGSDTNVGYTAGGAMSAGTRYRSSVDIWLPAGQTYTSITVGPDATGSTVITAPNLALRNQWQRVVFERTATATNSTIVLRVNGAAGTFCYSTAPMIEEARAPGDYILTTGSRVTVYDDVTTKQVTLAQPLPAAPNALSSWIVGEVLNVKKPFTLTGTSGNGVEKRKLTFMEYHDGVYGPSEVEIPVPVAAVTDRNVAHVSGLLFDYERLVAADRKAINARVHWSAAGIRNYAGADVYVSLNGEAFRPAGNAANMNELVVTLNEGDVPEFKVVAYNKRGDRAQFTTAPSVRGTIAVVYADLSPPTNLRATAMPFDMDGKAELLWDQPADMTGVTGFEARYRKKIDQTWTSAGTGIPSFSVADNRLAISGLETAVYIMQMRSTSQSSVSPWIEVEVAIAVTPGSIMQNYLSSNNRNATAIPAPVTRADIDVDHVINRDGSADLSFEWEWSGEEATIDGFEVMLVTNDT